MPGMPPAGGVVWRGDDLQQQALHGIRAGVRQSIVRTYGARPMPAVRRGVDRGFRRVQIFVPAIAGRDPVFVAWIRRSMTTCSTAAVGDPKSLSRAVHSNASPRRPEVSKQPMRANTARRTIIAPSNLVGTGAARTAPSPLNCCIMPATHARAGSASSNAVRRSRLDGTTRSSASRKPMQSPVASLMPALRAAPAPCLDCAT